MQPAIIDSQPVFFATAYSSEPVIITADVKVVKDDYFCFKNVLDGSIIEGQKSEYFVSFDVYSWDIKGESVANINYYWICIAEAALKPDPLV
jgi:hypothetical protein